MDENKNDVMITVDFHDDMDNVIGGIFAPDEKSGVAAQIYKMFEHGYTFELAPTVRVIKTDDNGNITEAELLGVSLITHTAKKHVKFQQETDVVIVDDEISNYE